MHTAPLLLGAGLLAGAMNALAGGGSFVTLAALVAAGLPSVMANASSTVALYPAGAASAWVYRGGLVPVGGLPLRPTLVATLLGGFAGALLLLATPASAFDRVVPWLLLVATSTLAAGPRLGVRLRARGRVGPGALLTVQVLLGVYGGYFGGAVGLMMMAAWSMIDGADVKALNPSRTVMVTAANSVAALCFAAAGAVDWGATLLVGVGAFAGGYGGAHLGRRLPATVVRAATVVLATLLTAMFFGRAYG